MLYPDHEVRLRSVTCKGQILEEWATSNAVDSFPGALSGSSEVLAGFSFAGDATRQKFTGYERDSESGLDYAHARYFSSTQGRFTSVDPLGKSANVLNPQSFNRYSYVNNNPTNFVDPSGMTLLDVGIVQTQDESFARTLQGASDSAFMRQVNLNYAFRHDASISYDHGRAILLSNNASSNFFNPREVPFNGYFDDEGILTWWYGIHYSLPSESAGTSIDTPAQSGTSNAGDDFNSLDITVGKTVGVALGATVRQDRFGRCYFGLHGGAGLGLFPASGSYTSGRVYDASGNRASDPDTIKTALSGSSFGVQVTLPTTDVVAASKSADPIVGEIPYGPTTVEAGRGTGIPSVSASKQQAFKVPKWLMFPVNWIAHCQ